MLSELLHLLSSRLCPQYLSDSLLSLQVLLLIFSLKMMNAMSPDPAQTALVRNLGPQSVFDHGFSHDLDKKNSP